MIAVGRQPPVLEAKVMVTSPLPDCTLVWKTVPAGPELEAAANDRARRSARLSVPSCHDRTGARF